ncbi:hypothetical protein SAMN04488523_102181 [Sulfitobacter brevis]|uniref:Uncharacterized protein n=1 Tax=Sulfitobacter brevis TaxID=74348 RepID=A0A1I1UN50_9RHOB|nr:hypothetical protein [Sulfitobacter brevis]SFD72187.1 hypothetical protein SAMN04488523_102181 [Sulfitobacter brevis]
MRKLTLGLLYILVAALVSVPPLLAVLVLDTCTEGAEVSCRGLSGSTWFGGEMALIWMSPLVVAAVLIWVIFRLRRGTTT